MVHLRVYLGYKPITVQSRYSAQEALGCHYVCWCGWESCSLCRIDKLVVDSTGSARHMFGTGETV